MRLYSDNLSLYSELSLCCLMTPGLHKQIRYHEQRILSYGCKSPDQTLGLMVSNVHFKYPQGFVWVCMVEHAHYHPEGGLFREEGAAASSLVVRWTAVWRVK